jgi:hypothetical protein
MIGWHFKKVHACPHYRSASSAVHKHNVSRYGLTGGVNIDRLCERSSFLLIQ